MGAIVNRTKEHLGTSDSAIIRLRRMLIHMAWELQEGTEPYAAAHANVYRYRPWSGVLPKGVDFDQNQDSVDAMKVGIS